MQTKEEKGKNLVRDETGMNGNIPEKSCPNVAQDVPKGCFTRTSAYPMLKCAKMSKLSMGMSMRFILFSQFALNITPKACCF